MDGGSDQAGQDVGWMEEVIRLVRTRPVARGGFWGLHVTPLSN